MKVGVVGLGLIGGSMAKAIQKKTEHTVVGWDASKTVRLSAKLLETADEFMADGNPKDCDLVLIALYPQATVDYVTQHAKEFKKGAMVVDCSGIKRLVCQSVQDVAKENGFLFIGGHPMAGSHKSGVINAKKHLFENAYPSSSRLCAVVAVHLVHFGKSILHALLCRSRTGCFRKFIAFRYRFAVFNCIDGACGNDGS